MTDARIRRSGPTGPVPLSTYRLQLTADRTLHSAAADVDYLRQLGVDWVYLSPLLQSTTGSEHGYDVTDHSRTDPVRGGRAGLTALADRAHAAGLGVLVDVVPNHVGVAKAEETPWWWDLLTHGRQSVFAAAFDVEWSADHSKVMIPVLGDGDDELAALRVVPADGDGPDELHYYDQRFPIAPGTAGGTSREIHDRQNYQLVNWRRGDVDLNYRRFFTITTLAGIRVELPEVLAASHVEIVDWIRSGEVDGLRIDHPDGLADPGGYLSALAELTGGVYVVVEKILEPGEELPRSWACAGTTGYDALAILDRLFVDPAGEAPLTGLDTELRGSGADWHRLIHERKRAVADGPLRAEVRRLARLLPELPAEIADDAVAEVLAGFPVYRSYLPLGVEYLEQAIEAAAAARQDLAEPLRVVGRRLAEVGSELSVRFQQTSGMVMAKGVEDNAFYRYTRLTSLCEVGADPSVFALSPAEFHAAQDDRLATWPASLTALTTHDTKRSEDTRARITVLSETPELWTGTVRSLSTRTPLRDGPLANLVWQAAVGAWPIERERLQAYATKASRESGKFSTWTEPDDDFDLALRTLVDALYDDPQVSAGLAAVVEAVRLPGWSNSLSAKLIQLMAPGVPDVYQGTELWDTSLVDPDNRRPVDLVARRELLARIDAGWLPPVDESGAAKLLVTSRGLRLRRDRPNLFTGYTPISATGAAAEHAIAFDRGGVVAVGTRLPVGLAAAGGWHDTRLELPPGSWTDVLTGRDVGPQVADLLATYPVALLERKDGG